MNTELLSRHNQKLQEKYARVERELVEWEEYYTEDAEYLFVAYGISARISLSAARNLREKNLRAGLLRPKTLYPFPAQRLKELSQQVKQMAVVELSNGQMAADVELAIASQVPVLKYNWMGGKVPSTDEVVALAEKDIKKLRG
jgi:pyruvate/2-oxoacid:ferredoxin oxidoreductase alpha subunit